MDHEITFQTESCCIYFTSHLIYTNALVGLGKVRVCVCGGGGGGEKKGWLVVVVKCWKQVCTVDPIF